MINAAKGVRHDPSRAGRRKHSNKPAAGPTRGRYWPASRHLYDLAVDDVWRSVARASGCARMVCDQRRARESATALTFQGWAAASHRALTSAAMINLDLDKSETVVTSTPH